MELASPKQSADVLFKSAKYKEAIPLYKEALAAPPIDKDIFVKLRYASCNPSKAVLIMHSF